MRWGDRVPLRGRVAVPAIACAAFLAPSRAPATPVPLVGSALAPPGSTDTGTAEDPLAPAAPDRRASGTDQPDVAAADNLTHVVYFVPRDKPDEDLDAAGGPIRRSIDSMLAWFTDEMSRRPRMDRTSTGAYDVTFLRGESNAATYTGLSAISEELDRRGFDQRDKRYLIYAAVNRGSVCGEGYYPMPDPLWGGEYSAVFLDSSAGCGARDFGGGEASNAGKTETIAAHEWMHNDGVVPFTAPHHCVPMVWHVCTGPLMFLPGVDPEEPDVAFPYITHRLRHKQLDIGRDDYLDHDRPDADLRDSPWLERSP